MGEVAAVSHREGGMGTFPKQMGTPGGLVASDKNNTRAGPIVSTFFHSFSRSEVSDKQVLLRIYKALKQRPTFSSPFSLT